MPKNKRITFIGVIFCAGFVPVVLAETTDQGKKEKALSPWELIRKSQMKKTESARPVSVGRVLHFPKERSFGRIMIRDANSVRDIKTFHYWVDGSQWEYFSKAQGDVKIPLNKKVRLILDSWIWQNPQALSALKRLQPDDIDSLILGTGGSQGGKSPDDKCMPYVSHLTGLKTLNLGNAEITLRGLRYLIELKSLERLYTHGGLTNKGLAEIARLSSLKALYIGNHSLTNDDLAHLAKLSLLEELDLTGIGRINNVGLTHLAKIPRLRYLMLQGENFTDVGIAHLKNCPSLRILHFGHLQQLTDAALVHLSEIPQLERISFHWNENITDIGIVHLTKLKSLTMLDIKHAKVTDEGLAHLGKIKTLENLTLPDIGITDSSFQHIAQLHNLRYLWAGSRSSSPLTDETLSIVGTLKNLEDLHIGGTGFSDEGMKHIAKLTNLKNLSLFTANQLTNDGLAELAKLTLLTDFNLGRHTNVSISGLKHLNSLKNLKTFRVRGIEWDDSILDISGLTELEDIIFILHRERKGDLLVSDSFKNEDWASLAYLKKLKRLQITGKGIDDEGVKYLSGLQNLEFLNIMCPDEERITDEALKYMTNMHKLNRLYIKDGHFTDKALDYIDGMSSLSQLELTSDLAFSNQAIRDFQRKNPNITKLKLIP